MFRKKMSAVVKERCVMSILMVFILAAAALGQHVKLSYSQLLELFKKPKTAVERLLGHGVKGMYHPAGFSYVKVTYTTLDLPVDQAADITIGFKKGGVHSWSEAAKRLGLNPHGAVEKSDLVKNIGGVPKGFILTRWTKDSVNFTYWAFLPASTWGFTRP